MPNGQIKNQKSVVINKTQHQRSVLLLKLIILTVILLVPLTFMIADVAKTYLVLKYSSLLSMKQDENKTLSTSNEFNFEAPLPKDQMGNLANVPKEKIDSLFNNLKN